MLKKERHDFIIREINLHKRVLSSNLAQQLGVSGDTVIRDLNELAERGKLLKVYGDALCSTTNHFFDGREAEYQDAKATAAAKAARLFSDNMSVLMGGGSIILEIAKQIPAKTCCTIFTISPMVALRLAGHARIQVILIGGEVCKTTGLTIGAQVATYLSDLKTDLCILEANALSARYGVTDSGMEVACVQKSMIKASGKLITVSMSQNLDSEQRIKVCDTKQIHTLITELDPDSKKLAEYHEAGINLS